LNNFHKEAPPLLQAQINILSDVFPIQNTENTRQQQIKRLSRFARLSETANPTERKSAITGFSNV